MPLHFGYGSNISWVKLQADMLRPLPGGVPPARGEVDRGQTAYIKGYRFSLRAANGTATIVSTGNDQDRVFGVLYRLTELQFDRLRSGEGWESPMIEVPVHTADGIYRALTWLWPESEDKAQPVARYYVELIIEAARARSIDPAYLDAALAPIIHERKRFKAF